MITCTVKGDFKNTYGFLKRAKKLKLESLLTEYAEEGVQALSAATPKESGVTASSWGYEIVNERNNIAIYWTNSNVNDGVPIAIIINFGHATGWGGYVRGRQYISPAIQPVFDKISDAIQKEVSKS